MCTLSLQCSVQSVRTMIVYSEARLFGLVNSGVLTSVLYTVLLTLIATVLGLCLLSALAKPD